MTPLEAEKIVNRYGMVLETTASETLGVSESLLPVPKEIIKEAIRVCVAFTIRRDSRNPLTLAEIEQFRIGYASLANFISVEDAKIAHDANEALLSGNTGHPRWNASERGLQIAQENAARRKDLAKEFASFLNSIACRSESPGEGLL